MAKRYRLHWSSGRGPSPDLKWEIWDWSRGSDGRWIGPVAYLANRALGREICRLLNASVVSLFR